MNTKTAIFLTITILSATGCAGIDRTPPDLAPGLRAQGASEAYIAGAEHGCKSGFSVENRFFTYAKDHARAQSDPDYAAGWGQWYENCSRRMKSVLRR